MLTGFGACRAHAVGSVESIATVTAVSKKTSSKVRLLGEGVEPPEASELRSCGADDGIRTRDPHLGNPTDADE
jgi:hypothetical protein